jgi:hypothetical protein
MSAANDSPAPTPWRERPTLRIAEVADLLGVSPDSVQKLIESEDLAVRYCGRIPLVVTSSLIEWTEGKSVGKSSAQGRQPSITAKHRAEADRLMNRRK